VISNELTNDEITLHEILHHILEINIAIYGDELEIHHPTDTIHEILEVREGDHVLMDGMYLVDENGQI
jgi:hypothetical protein